MIWLSVWLSFAVLPIDGYRILAIISVPAYSHQGVYKPLWRELSLRGHEVTVLTSDPVNDPSLINLHEIDTSATYTYMKSINMTEMFDLNRFQMYDISMEFGNNITDFELQLPQVQTIINNRTEHFDVVLVEFLYPAMYAFAERFKCPLIAVSTLEGMSRTYNAIGNPHHPFVSSECFAPSVNYSTFRERFVSVFFSFYVKHLSYYMYGLEQDKIVEKHFGKGYPSVADMEKSISMMFINTDLLFHNIHPLLPSIVPVGGGMHVQPSKPLPVALQKQCDDAKNGFIYFSLGSTVKCNILPMKTLRMLLDTFAELPYTVFWKFETDDLTETPKNVIINKWFPQQSLLGHPNIKLFITQGGLQSLHEAILNKVPIIGIPFIGDQPKNVEMAALKEVGLKLNMETITKELLSATIMEVIKNPKYRNNAEKYAALLKDEPMSSLEKAVWWTEYVIRHKGAKHFRSYGADIPSYQYYLLDVVGFCLAVLGVLITLLVLLLKLLIKIFKKVLFSKPKRD